MSGTVIEPTRISVVQFLALEDNIRRLSYEIHQLKAVSVNHADLIREIMNTTSSSVSKAELMAAIATSRYQQIRSKPVDDDEEDNSYDGRLQSLKKSVSRLEMELKEKEKKHREESKKMEYETTQVKKEFFSLEIKLNDLSAQISNFNLAKKRSRASQSQSQAHSPSGSPKKQADSSPQSAVQASLATGNRGNMLITSTLTTILEGSANAHADAGARRSSQAVTPQQQPVGFAASANAAYYEGVNSMSTNNTAMDNAVQENIAAASTLSKSEKTLVSGKKKLSTRFSRRKSQSRRDSQSIRIPSVKTLQAETPPGSSESSRGLSDIAPFNSDVSFADSSEWSDGEELEADDASENTRKVEGADVTQKAQDVLREYLDLHDSNAQIKRAAISSISKQARSLCARNVEEAMSTISRITGCKRAVLAMGDVYKHGMSDAIVEGEQQSSTLEEVLTSSVTVLHSQSIIVNESETDEHITNPKFSNDTHLCEDEHILSSSTVLALDSFSKFAPSPALTPVPLVAEAPSDLPTLTTSSVSLDNVFSDTEQLNTNAPGSVGRVVHALSGGDATELRNLLESTIKITELLDHRMTLVQQQLGDHERSISNLLAVTSDQLNQMNKAVAPVLAASRASVHRVDRCVEKVNDVFEAVRQLDIEHNSLLVAHQALLKDVDKKESTLLHLVDDIVSSVDNFQNLYDRQEASIAKQQEWIARFDQSNLRDGVKSKSILFANKTPSLHPHSFLPELKEWDHLVDELSNIAPEATSQIEAKPKSSGPRAEPSPSRRPRSHSLTGSSARLTFGDKTPAEPHRPPMSPTSGTFSRPRSPRLKPQQKMVGIEAPSVEKRSSDLSQSQVVNPVGFSSEVEGAELINGAPSSQELQEEFPSSKILVSPVQGSEAGPTAIVEVGVEPEAVARADRMDDDLHSECDAKIVAVDPVLVRMQSHIDELRGAMEALRLLVASHTASSHLEQSEINYHSRKAESVVLEARERPQQLPATHYPQQLPAPSKLKISTMRMPSEGLAMSSPRRGDLMKGKKLVGSAKPIALTARSTGHVLEDEARPDEDEGVMGNLGRRDSFFEEMLGRNILTEAPVPPILTRPSTRVRNLLKKYTGTTATASDTHFSKPVSHVPSATHESDEVRLKSLDQRHIQEIAGHECWPEDVRYVHTKSASEISDISEGQ